MRDMITHARSVDLENNPFLTPLDITVNDRAATREVLFEQLRMKGISVMERSAWHARPAKSGMEQDWDYTMIAIHHAGRSYACAAGASQISTIQNSHHEKGFNDIAYHFGIDCTGAVFEGRDIRLKGSHVRNYNTGVIGIVLMEDLTTPEEGSDLVASARQFMEHLGFNTQNAIPDEQKKTVLALATILMDLFSITVLGAHREFPQQLGDGKICPGNHGLEHVQLLRGLLGLAPPPGEQ
jgi:hypothetical protein